MLALAIVTAIVQHSPNQPVPVQVPVQQDARPTQKPSGSNAGSIAAPASTGSQVEANPEVIVYLRDGSVFQGLLIERTNERLVVDIAGVPATFETFKIDRLTELPPVLDRYKELRDLIPETDVDQRINIVRWLADRRQIELALAEAELMLAKNPKHIGAIKLESELRTRHTLLTSNPGLSTERRPSSGTADPSRITPDEFPFLTPDQINLIKVYEIDLNASPRPRVSIPRPVVAKLIEEFAASPLIPNSREGRDAILRQEPSATLDLIFRLRAREYYTKARVMDQPEPMRRFRDDVHRSIVMGGCATSGCHGGKDAGRLVLSTYSPNSDATVYTNYYILNNFQTSTGAYLIDWERPEQSLLLQMALPRDESRAPHPRVMIDGADQYRPALSGPDDRRALAFVEWIRSAYRPRPQYTLDYHPYRPLQRPAPPPKSEPQATPVER